VNFGAQKFRTGSYRHQGILGKCQYPMPCNATLSQIKLRKSFSQAKFWQKSKLCTPSLVKNFMMQKAGVTGL
jgi:hypothetical protein